MANEMIKERMKKRLFSIFTAGSIMVTGFLLQSCNHSAPHETFGCVTDSKMTSVDYGQVFECVKYHILHNDKEWLAKHADYPFFMSFPLKDIASEKEFIQQYEKLFDRDFKKRITSISANDIDEEGFYSNYFKDGDKDLVLQLSKTGISWMMYDTKEIVKERNRTFDDIRDIICSDGEPIGCYLSEDSTLALILETFYEDDWGEYGRAHVYHKYDKICNEDFGEVYHGRLTYHGASCDPGFTMVDESGNSWIYLSGERAGNISTLWLTMSDRMDLGEDPSTYDRYESELKSIYFYQLLELWNR